jgi:hypothetical protein
MKAYVTIHENKKKRILIFAAIALCGVICVIWYVISDPSYDENTSDSLYYAKLLYLKQVSFIGIQYLTESEMISILEEFTNHPIATTDYDKQYNVDHDELPLVNLYNVSMPYKGNPDQRHEGLFGHSLKEIAVNSDISDCIYALKSKCSEELIAWLSEQSSAASPRPLDVIIYFAVSAWGSGTGFLNLCEFSFWENTAVHWETMQQSKNPIYRLLALDWLELSEPDSEKRRQIYAKALGEKSSAFHYGAVVGLTNYHDQDSVSLLKEFLAENEDYETDYTASRDVKVCIENTIQYIEGELTTP